MLVISNLTAALNDRIILDNISVTIKEGEKIGIIGKNGAGKSSLAHVICGLGDYQITNGLIELHNEDITQYDISKRASTGIFLAYQTPVAIPGLNLAVFIKEVINAQKRRYNEPELTSHDVLTIIKQYISLLNFPEQMYTWEVNNNLSGGQKKLVELLQIAVMKPKVVILDEIDSGLDISTLDTFYNSVKILSQNNSIWIIISHNPEVLKRLDLDHILLLQNGSISKIGGIELFDNFDDYDSTIN